MCPKEGLSPDEDLAPHQKKLNKHTQGDFLCSSEEANEPALAMASATQPACSSAVQKCHWRRTLELDHWNSGCSCSQWIHPLALSLAWIAYQAICTQDNPDGKLEAASYYFIITASIMTGPERLIAAGEVSGQGTKKESNDEAWHMWLCKRCAAGLASL